MIVRTEEIIRCPYCDNVQKYRELKEGFNTLLCYPEDGGCDQYFTIRIRYTSVITTFRLEEWRTHIEDTPGKQE